MKLILGLGNPEPHYDGTRHNVGFAALDTYATSHDLTFRDQPKFRASIAEYQHGSEKLLLAKPTTYYNEVGQSARALIDFYKLDISDILIVHDELMLNFGTIRVRHNGRDAGNNGVKSLITHLGTSEFARIRIGIASEHRVIQSDSDYVLARFSADETNLLRSKLLPVLQDFINQFADELLVDHSIVV